METVERPNWDEMFLAIAAINSSRGTCDRLRTSCVLVKNNRIVGGGYNGAVAGLENCDEIGHLMVENHCLRTLHGEQNAIANAQCDLHGATAYIIATPCPRCIKELLQHGITRIVYVGEYNNGPGAEQVAQFCKEKNVSLEQISNSALLAESFRKIFNRLQGPGGIFRGMDLKKILFPENEL